MITTKYMRAKSSPWNADIELALFVTKGDVVASVAEPVTLRDFDDEEEIRSFCALDRTQAQVLMDDLWNAGIRPTDGTGSAGQLQAVQEHLADMRKLVFWTHDPAQNPWPKEFVEGHD